MGSFQQTRVHRETPRGNLTFVSFCRPGDIESARFPADFGRYPRYRPILSSKQKLMETAGEPDANVVLALTSGHEIVGVAVLAYPSPDERWRRVGDRVMMEVAVIEVNRQWRSMGVAGMLMTLLLSHPLVEDRICYLVGYSWTWDLDGSNKTPMEYRTMLGTFFAGYGFKPYQTNDPNVNLRPENLFMARIGSRISQDIQMRFKRVRFNLDLHAS